MSVNRALKYLREHNFIQSVKAGGATVYVVNNKVAWQGNRGERYAAFGADVLAIEAEQEQDLIDDPRPLKERAEADRASGCSLAMSRSTRQTKASWNSHSQGRAGIGCFPFLPAIRYVVKCFKNKLGSLRSPRYPQAGPLRARSEPPASNDGHEGKEKARSK